MRTIAAVADVMGLVPFLNLGAPFLMWLAGEISGVKVISLSSAPRWTIVTLVIELIPILAMFPMWSIRTHFALLEADSEKRN